MWPTLTTVADVMPAWAALPDLADEFDEIAALRARVEPPRADLVGELFELSNRRDEFTRYGAPIGTPRDLIAAEQRGRQWPSTTPVDGTDFRGFWANWYGVDELRRRARAGDRSNASRARLRDLAEHVNGVLFPALVPVWAGYGDRYADAVRFRDAQPDRTFTTPAFERVPVTLRGTAVLGPKGPIPNE